MRHFAGLLLVLAVMTGSLFAQQASNPVTGTVRDILLPRQQKNITAAVEEMPADKFGYKPTPDQMSFGHLVVHIIESNNAMCAKASDVAAPKVEDPKETDGKDKLVSALNDSFDFCKAALAKADDAKLGDNITVFGTMQGPRALALIALTSGWADHYGAAAIYLRLNGLLPPTAKSKSEAPSKK